MRPNKKEFIEYLKTKKLREISMIYDVSLQALYNWMDYWKVREIYNEHQNELNIRKIKKIMR